jgi:hypothetical protein
LYNLAELREEYGLSIIREWDVDEDDRACEGRGKRVWIRLYNKEFHDLYCSPNVPQVIKSRKMRWAGHVALM